MKNSKQHWKRMANLMIRFCVLVFAMTPLLENAAAMPPRPEAVKLLAQKQAKSIKERADALLVGLPQFPKVLCQLIAAYAYAEPRGLTPREVMAQGIAHLIESPRYSDGVQRLTFNLENWLINDVEEPFWQPEVGNIYVLYLGHNLITHIGAGALKGFDQLDLLGLYNNKLQKFPEAAFEDIPKTCVVSDAENPFENDKVEAKKSADYSKRVLKSRANKRANKEER